MRVYPDSNFKQPSLKRTSVFALASGFPRELRIQFSISLPQGAFHLTPSKREQSAVWRKEFVPLQGARDRSCRTGLALRRSTAASSSPWCPTSYLTGSSPEQEVKGH